MKTTFLKALCAIAVTGASMLAGSAAQATPLSFNWSTTVSASDATYGVNAGDVISGVLTYDVTGNSLYGNPPPGNTGYQYYTTPNTSTTLNFGSFHGTVILNSTMIINDFFGGDKIIWRGANSSLNVELQLMDTTMTKMSNLALPTTIDLSMFNYKGATFTNYAPYNSLYGSSTQFAVAGANVPEPGTTALFGLALAGLAAIRRRRMR